MAHWLWNDVREVDWRRHLASAGKSAFEQAWAYGEAAVAIGGFRVDRGVAMHQDRAIAIVQAFTRRYAGLVQVTQLLRGPLWLSDEITAEDRATLLHAIKTRFTSERLRFLYWVPELDASAAQEMRTVRLHRVMTGYSSIWLDLAPTAEDLRRALDGSWRNMVTSAERNDLVVKTGHGGQDFERLLARDDEQRRRRRFRAVGSAFLRTTAAATKPRSDVLVTSAHQGSEMVAGALFFRHGQAATYYVGWTSESGRKAHAQNLLLWRGILELKQVGVRWIDLGGLDTARQPGIARFKLGLGGTPYTLAGSYL
ncbi:MAG: GNAT family N-acetyltransferase [Alphaproteobacteria bacterium]|nr:GNAT family N-acetyltransferase [Alphaproteobacteria bacterium]